MIGDAYPCLRPDSADYLQPDGYSVDLRQDGQELKVTHRLADLRCLPAQWLREGCADLCCEVRAPQMLFSQRFTMEEQPSLPTRGACELLQVVEFMAIPEPGNLDIFFLPAIVLREAREIRLDSAAHGVSSLWDGRRVRFPRGAILAGGEVNEDRDSIVHLLRFDQDDALKDGTLSGRAESEGDVWRYVVRVPGGMLEDLRNPHHQVWAHAVYTGCLTQMLVAIREEFHDPEQQRPAAVQKLGEMIREETSGKEAPPWDADADEAWRDPLQLASMLRPLLQPDVEGGGA